MDMLLVTTVDQDVTSAVNTTKNYKSGKEILAMVVAKDKLYLVVQTQNITFVNGLIDKSHRNVTAIAHNGRADDAYFIYNYLMSISICPEPAIFSGSKIMYMYIQKLNLRLLESLNFLPMPLAKLPKSFDLKEMKRGFFPHFYKTKKHEHDIYHVYQICNTMTLIVCQKREGKSNIASVMLIYYKKHAVTLDILMMEVTGTKTVL